MGSKVGSLILALLIAAAFMTGCFFGKDGRSSVTQPAVLTEPLTSVRFEISLPAESISLRAAVGDVPQVFFELRLLDRSSSSFPVVILRKQAQVTAGDGGFVASARFENVAVLPAIASMSINGGYLVGADSQQYRIWVGRKDLVAASENVITLVGKGDKSPVDVAVNLLDRLIVVPANVAKLALPIFEKVDGIVAGLNLNSATVYDDAYAAYNAAYGVITVPADAEFAPPADYASLAFPKKDSSVQLLMPSFTAASEAWVVLMNRSSGNLTPSWSVPIAVSGALRHSAVQSSQESYASSLPSSEELNFHLKLRKFSSPPGSGSFSGSIRPSLRAVAINDNLTFKAYVSGTTAISTVNARCRYISQLSNGSKTFFFVDVDDLALSGIDSVLSGLDTRWAAAGSGIFDTNRNVFGIESPGTLNSSNLDDFNTNGDIYILISRKIYTAGYFWATDLYPPTVFAESNHKKIFFLQLSSSLSDLNREINDLSATMAHEFQHMIHFWQKRKLLQPDAWLDEAMSGYAEYINGFRIENQNNQSKALQVNYYFERVNSVRVDKWHLESDTNLVMGAHYGKAFLFGVWLAQNYGSNASVQNLISVQLTEKPAVEAFTGESFDKTFAKFMLALAVNDYFNGGIYGFKGLDLTSTYSFGASLSPVTLTGPARRTVSVATAGDSASPAISPYAAAYVKIINGNGGNVSFNATLPTGVSLFHLQK